LCKLYDLKFKYPDFQARNMDYCSIFLDEGTQKIIYNLFIKDLDEVEKKIEKFLTSSLAFITLSCRDITSTFMSTFSPIKICCTSNIFILHTRIFTAYFIDC
jgi:hypothetical protein